MRTALQAMDLEDVLLLSVTLEGGAYTLEKVLFSLPVLAFAVGRNCLVFNYRNGKRLRPVNQPSAVSALCCWQNPASAACWQHLFCHGINRPKGLARSNLFQMERFLI